MATSANFICCVHPSAHSEDKVIEAVSYHSQPVGFDHISRKQIQISNDVLGHPLWKGDAEIIIIVICGEFNVKHGHLPQDYSHPLLRNQEIRLLQISFGLQLSQLPQAQVHVTEKISRPITRVTVHG